MPGRATSPMVETALEIISWVLLLTGGMLGIMGGIGLVRFPDFYSRLHAGGITDTLCAFLIIVGLIIQAGLALASLKLALILIFFVFTAPTASHALAHAARTDGIEPATSDEHGDTRPESEGG